MSQRDLEGWTIAFDLDGTLVDSAPDLIGTLNRLLMAEGLPPRPLEAARHLVGHGAMALLKDGFAEAGAEWNEDDGKVLFDAFIKDYIANIAVETRPFPSCVEVLDRLSARGAKLCVATNKRTDLSLALLDALELTDRFAAIVGPDAVSAKKPDGAHIREAVLKAGGDPAKAIMVGDSTTDTGAAANATVPCILVSFGYSDVPMDQMGGDITIDHYDEFEPALAQLIG
ncbi:HAD-IA family hydrolase [Brevundimonas sp.]|uniref:HAD-IA family hydrolase n=1 Tax=Brevundimonas sp. TaxID=1871086 RepID=UPI002FCC3DE9